VNLGQDLARGDLVATLLAEDDSDCVVDLVAGGAAAGTETQRREPDARRREGSHMPIRGCDDLVHDRSLREDIFVRVSALRADPALVGL
jgi:hypothetical protein